MSARTFTEQRAQYGQEVTPGTAVAASRRFASAAITIGPDRSTERLRSSGEYFDSLVYETRNTSAGTLEGTPSFGPDLIDVFTLVFGNPTVTDHVEYPDQAWNYEWTLQPARNTWTLEYGDSTDASVATGVFAKSIELAWGANSGDSTMTVGLEGNEMIDGVSLTPDSVLSAVAPITAQQVQVYVSDSLAGLEDLEPLEGGLRQTFKLDNIASLVKFFGSSDTVNTAPDAILELKAVVSAATRALATTNLKYIRIYVSGPDIPGIDLSQRLVIDVAVRGEGNPERGNEDEVYAATVPLRIVKDASDFALRVRLTSDIEPA